MGKPVLRTARTRISAPVPRAAKAREKPLSAFDPAPDPLDQRLYPPDLEGSTKMELEQLRTGFKDRMERERERVQNATDAGYYFVAVFEVYDQVSAFLRALGLPDDRVFIDGRILARAMGIEIPPVDVRYNTGGPNDWADLVRKPKRRT